MCAATKNRVIKTYNKANKNSPTASEYPAITPAYWKPSPYPSPYVLPGSV